MAIARNIVGGAFVAILFIGVVYAAVSPVLQPIIFPGFEIPWLGAEGEKVVERYSLVKETNVSDTVKFVDLNVSVKFGGINLLFSNNPNLACGISFERSVNASELEIGYVESDGGQVLQVDLYGESGGLNLTLGNSYQYSGTFGLRIGGVMMELGQYANISKFAVFIKYVGGLNLKINSGASFEQVDLSVDIGGLQLTVDADSLKSDGVINAGVNIGGFSMGVDVDTSEVGVSMDATVDIGGLTVNHEDFEGQVSERSCSLKTVGYAGATHKLDVKVTVGLGGGTLQKGAQYGFLISQV